MVKRLQKQYGTDPTSRARQQFLLARRALIQQGYPQELVDMILHMAFGVFNARNIHRRRPNRKNAWKKFKKH